MITHPLHYVRFLLNKELNALYVSIVLRSLAFSMVGIFVPLYLYIELGYSFSYVIYFYILYSLFFGVMSFPSSWFVDRFSFRYIVLITSPIYILYFVLLYFLRFNPGLFFIIPVIQGAVEALFWLGFHFEFSGVSDKRERGKEIGNWYNFSLLAGLVGPMMGGSVLLFSGFSLLFLLVGVLLLGSAVPMFFSGHKNKCFKVKIKEVFKKRYFRDGVAFIGQGGTFMVAVVLWPIFIFSFLGGYLKLGSLATMVSLIAILFTLVMGRLSDKYNRRRLMRIGAVFHSIAWFMKMFIQNVGHVVGLFIFRGVASIAAELPFTALVYDKARHRTEYFIMREMYLSVGRILILVLILGSGKLIHGFFYAGVFSLFQMFL